MKRFVSIAEYQRITGLSYSTVKNMIKNNQCSYIQTEAGHYKIDTVAGEELVLCDIIQQLDEQGQLLKKLCKHLGIVIVGGGNTQVYGE